MTTEELKQERNRLERQKKSYDSNRNLSMILAVFLVYTTVKDIKANPGTWYFYLIMGLLFAAACAIAVRDTLKLRKIDEQLRETAGKLEETTEN